VRAAAVHGGPGALRRSADATADDRVEIIGDGVEGAAVDDDHHAYLACVVLGECRLDGRA
jgi:hypothetical protein